MGATRQKGSKPSAKVPPSRATETSPKSKPVKRTGESSRPEAIAKGSAIFRMVGDPTRLRLLLALAEGERGVGDLCTQLGGNQPAISHRLALLRHSGLIRPRRLGNKNIYSLTDQGEHVLSVVRELVPSQQAGEPRPAPTKPIDPTILDEVSGFVDDAEAWFHSPNPAFGGRKPIDLLGTAEEERLKNRIMAAKLGMFS